MAQKGREIYSASFNIPSSSVIPEVLYKQILSVMPLVCVDLVIRNDKGQYLLVRRKNEPLKGEWWVVGGRILHGEAVREACVRKTLEEVGLAIVNLHFLGFYEDLFDRNAFQVPEQYHTLSLVFETCVSTEQVIELDLHHSDWEWFDSLPDRFTFSSPNDVEPAIASRPVVLTAAIR